MRKEQGWSSAVAAQYGCAAVRGDAALDYPRLQPPPPTQPSPEPQSPSPQGITDASLTSPGAHALFPHRASVGSRAIFSALRQGLFTEPLAHQIS